MENITILRGWHIPSNKMYYKIGIIPDDNGNEDIFIINNNEIEIIDSINNFIIMKYIGYPDKTNKRIFDKDIIEFDKDEWYRPIYSKNQIKKAENYYESVEFDYEYLNMRKND